MPSAGDGTQASAKGRNVAFIGTGIMGSQMARRLAQAGFSVTACDRICEKAERLVEFGVTVAEAPAQALAGADAAILMVIDGPSCDAVLFDPDSSGTVPADAMREGTILIVMSSIPVETAQRQAERMGERGVVYIDAPVSGGEVGARDGTLTIMAGGPADAIEAAADLFAPLGRVTRIGDAGSGSLAKLANQLIVGVNIGAVAEAFVMARKAGADPAALREALTGGFADSRILQVHGARMIEGAFKPGGTVAVTLKDLTTAAAYGKSMGLDLPFLGLVEALYADAVAHGDGELDQSALYVEIVRRNKMPINKKSDKTIS